MLRWIKKYAWCSWRHRRHRCRPDGGPWWHCDECHPCGEAIDLLLKKFLAICGLIDSCDRAMNVDNSSRVSGELAGYGHLAVGPIAEALLKESSAPGFNQAYALLSALRWIDPLEKDDPRVDRAFAAILKYLSDKDPCLREQAVGAVCVLPKQKAVALLEAALVSEVDGDVLDTVRDKLVELINPYTTW